MAIEPHQKYLLVRLTEAGLSQELLSVQTGSPARHAVLDFTRITYIGSIHLGQLLKLRQHQNLNERRLVLVGLRPEVRKLFRLTSLDVILEIHDREEDVVALFR